MDGVIVDWESAFKKLSGGVSSKSYEFEHGKEARHKLSYDNSPDFYINMDWMKDGKELFNYLKNQNTEILSHSEGESSNDTRSRDGKLIWLKNNFVKLKPNLVPNREDKSKFAAPNAILIDDREDNVNEFINAGGKAILHKNAEDTINQLKNMNIKEKHRIYNSILDPHIWDDDATLKQEVLDKLLDIAKTFYGETELSAPIEDILFLGSAANYNWTPSSDIDLHILVDFNKIDDNTELVKKYVDKLKGSWNSTHDINIGKNPVELYIQDISEENKSEGVYSILNNKWIKKPSYKEPSIDKENIKKKYLDYKDIIDDLKENPDVDKLKVMLKKIYDMRKSGLEKNGEYSTENIVFKLLRKTGHLNIIRELIINLTDDDLSLNT
jgi:predicted nucleotidyltransferase